MRNTTGPKIKSLWTETTRCRSSFFWQQLRWHQDRIPRKSSCSSATCNLKNSGAPTSSCVENFTWNLLEQLYPSCQFPLSFLNFLQYGPRVSKAHDLCRIIEGSRILLHSKQISFLQFEMDHITADMPTDGRGLGHITSRPFLIRGIY